MWKEYEIVFFERDGQQKKCNITDTQLNEFLNLTEILDTALQQKQVKTNKIRYFNLRNLAWRLLIKSGVNSMPIDLSKIAVSNNWTVLSYQKHAAAIAIIDKLGLRNKREGFSCEVAGRAIVCYNEINNKGRMRWTIAHEFGHLAMAHSAAAIDNYEQEANMFARRLLSPMGVLRACEIKDAAEIARLCEISNQAAEYTYIRYLTLLERGKFFTSRLERKLRRRFKKFTNAYKRKSHKD